MSKRLTSYTREQITRAVLVHRFSDEVDALISRRRDLAEDIYNDIYRKPDREKMEALPAGWLPESSVIAAQFGDSRSYAELSFNGATYSGIRCYNKDAKTPKDERRRVLSKHNRSCSKVYSAEHRLSARYREIADAEQDLIKNVRSAEQKIVAALGATSSIPTLLKAWPEVEPFVKRFMSVPAKLPAIPVDALNESLRLPVAEAA